MNFSQLLNPRISMLSRMPVKLFFPSQSAFLYQFTFFIRIVHQAQDIPQLYHFKPDTTAYRLSPSQQDDEPVSRRRCDLSSTRFYVN